MVTQEEIIKRWESEKEMSPGVYLITKEEKRFIATIDDIIYGDVEDHRDIGHDLVNAIRDSAVDLVSEDDDTAICKMVIAIVQ